MNYTKHHIPVLDSKEGYDLLHKQYNAYHKTLAAIDKGCIERYLPRSLQGKCLLDVGGGDGRVAHRCKDKGLAQYVILDVAPKLMAAAPSRCEKREADVQQGIPGEKDFDIILCFFVLLHLDDPKLALEHMLWRLAPGGRMLLLHHLERRPYVHKIPNMTFKIKTYAYSFKELEKMLKDLGAERETIELEEGVRLYILWS